MNEVSDCLEMDFLMNGTESDVVFVIEGQPLPAHKLMFRMKSKVFRAMFSGEFKETKDKEVVIEDTTFEAFKTLIQFIYCDRLVLKDDNDLELIHEVCKLGDRYEVPKLLEKVEDYLMTFALKSSDSVTFNWISKIVFDYKLTEVMAKVLAIIDENFKSFVKK